MPRGHLLSWRFAAEPSESAGGSPRIRTEWVLDPGLWARADSPNSLDPQRVHPAVGACHAIPRHDSGSSYAAYRVKAMRGPHFSTNYALR